MTLIHDDDGDPNQTYYDSKYLAPGWLPGYPNYSVHTAEESYQGTINVTKATALSDNTVYAQLGVDVGMRNVDKIAHAMGITSQLYRQPVGGDRRPQVRRLGAADVRRVRDACQRRRPHRADDHLQGHRRAGKTIYTANPDKTQVFSQGEAYAGTQTLETVMQYGTGTGANYGCPAAGKTGTTSNYTDAWFVGYTPKLSTAVWVGYPNSDVYMNDVNGLGPGYGGTLAAPIWSSSCRPPPTATAATSRRRRVLARRRVLRQARRLGLRSAAGDHDHVHQHEHDRRLDHRRRRAADEPQPERNRRPERDRQPARGRGSERESEQAGRRSARHDNAHAALRQRRHRFLK